MAVGLTRIRPIRSRREFDAAIRQIEQLWNAKPGTQEGEMREVLVDLAWAYEERSLIQNPYREI